MFDNRAEFVRLLNARILAELAELKREAREHVQSVHATDADVDRMRDERDRRYAERTGLTASQIRQKFRDVPFATAVQLAERQATGEPDDGGNGKAGG
jgi:hypothetical protein